MREIGERRSLAQELGDREEARLVGDVPVAQQALRRPDRHRAADDDDRRRIEPGDVGQDRLDGTDVGVAVVVDRRPDADQDDLGRRLRSVVEDRQVARGQGRVECLLDALLGERNAALAQRGETVAVRLDQFDPVAHPGQADGADETDIAGPDDGDGAPGGITFLHRAEVNRRRA